MTEQEIIDKISKPATLFKVGGFKPSEEKNSSWFGKVLLSKEGEKWPEYNGNLLTPLCQLNISSLPYKPDELKEIVFMTVFIDENGLNKSTNKTVIVRTYKSLEDLVELEQPNYNSSIKPFQLEPYLEKNDCPTWDDCPMKIPEEFEENYEIHFENKAGIKIGGWPSLIQGEIFLESNDAEYIFQIDSIEKANWQWGDGGVGYFAKDSKTQNWLFEWQCY